MELYLFLSFVLLYVLTAFFVKKNVQHKIWTFAFIIAFVITSLSIGFLRVNQQDVMNVGQPVELVLYALPFRFDVCRSWGHQFVDVPQTHVADFVRKSRR